MKKGLLQAQLGVMLASMLADDNMTEIVEDPEEERNFKRKRIGHTNNPVKECKVCEREHRLSSSFCSDSCTREYINNKHKYN